MQSTENAWATEVHAVFRQQRIRQIGYVPDHGQASLLSLVCADRGMRAIPLTSEEEGVALAVGASGGRKIMPAVAQILSFMLDFGMDLDAAFHCPRIDVSGGEVALIDRRLGRPALDAVGRIMKAEFTDLAPYPAQFANPSAAQAAPDGVKLGATDLASPWSGAVTPSDLQ